MFLKEGSNVHQGCIYLNKNTVKNSNIVKYYYNFNIFKNVVCSRDNKAEFSASLLQSLVSHDPSEIIFIC